MLFNIIISVSLEEETKAPRFSNLSSNNLPKIAHLGSGGARIQAQGLWAQELAHSSVHCLLSCHNPRRVLSCIVHCLSYLPE